MADVPATEQLANGLGGQHHAAVQVMGAMPLDDLLKELQKGCGAAGIGPLKGLELQRLGGHWRLVEVSNIVAGCPAGLPSTEQAIEAGCPKEAYSANVKDVLGTVLSAQLFRKKDEDESESEDSSGQPLAEE
eukprot:Skav209179  [mRNA]  locus=scaffold1137:526472:529235:- [translate_table: standard]